MHTKTKGGLGVSKAISYFIANEIPVFVEALCDLSVFDLVVHHKGSLKTVQVKTTTSHNENAVLSLISTTPGTRKTPCKRNRIPQSVDYLVLYVEDKDQLLFISGKDTIDYKAEITFSFDNKPRTKHAKDYMIFGT